MGYQVGDQPDWIDLADNGTLRAEVRRLKEAAKPRSYHDVTDLYEDPPEPAITAPDDAMFCSKHELIREQRKRERVWKVADELVVALGDMCVHANEPCRCEERGQECVCGWAATRRSAEALIANHAKLKGE